MVGGEGLGNPGRQASIKLAFLGLGADGRRRQEPHHSNASTTSDDGTPGRPLRVRCALLRVRNLDRKEVCAETAASQGGNRQPVCLITETDRQGNYEIDENAKIPPPHGYIAYLYTVHHPHGPRGGGAGLSSAAAHVYLVDT